MEADGLNDELGHIMKMTSTLLDNGTLVPLKMVAEEGGVSYMIVMVTDIPFVDPESFKDVGVFTHQAIVRCVYVNTPTKYFHIVGSPTAVQQCIRQYILGCISNTAKKVLRWYTKENRNSPAPYPLWCCDVRNVQLPHSKNFF
jgi:hypothetical protein